MTCTANCRRSRSRPRGNHTRSSSTRYIEPFCGSAGLFFDLQCWGISTMELLCAFSFNKARLFGGPDRPVKLTPATSPFPRLGWVLTGSIAAGSEYPLGNDRTGRVLQRVCSDTSRNTPQDRATSGTWPSSHLIGEVVGTGTVPSSIRPPVRFARNSSSTLCCSLLYLAVMHVQLAPTARPSTKASERLQTLASLTKAGIAAP